MFSIDLSGQNIVVTGGSRGIGAGICQILAEAGARIALSYSSNEEAAQKVVSSLAGQGHFAFRLDVKDEKSVEEAFATVFQNYEGVHGLINNAGITRDQLLLRMKTEDFDEVLATNLRGTYLCTKQVLKPMIKARQGSIVNISSVIGATGNSGQANYAASKAGVEAFSKSVALEVASRGVRVNCIAPGFIKTEMTEQLSDGQVEKIKERVPMGWLGEVNDIGGATLFLLSNHARYMTGQTLHINGGMYMN